MEDSKMGDSEVVYPVHMPGERVMAPVTWDEWQALLDVAEAALEARQVSFVYYSPVTARLRAALDRLEEVRRDL